MKYLISILIVFSCVLSEVDAQQYQMEAINPDKKASVTFYSKPNLYTGSKSTFKNVDSVRVVIPQPLYVATNDLIEVRLKNSDLKLFIRQSYFTKDRQEYFNEWRKKLIEERETEKQQKQATPTGETAAEVREKQRQEKEKERINNLTNKYGKEVTKKIIDGLAWVGMTEDMFLESWGKPSDISKIITAYGVSKTYTYDLGDYNYQFVYFDNGKCTAISE